MTGIVYGLKQEVGRRGATKPSTSIVGTADINAVGNASINLMCVFCKLWKEGGGEELIVGTHLRLVQTMRLLLFK